MFIFFTWIQIKISFFKFRVIFKVFKIVVSFFVRLRRFDDDCLNVWKLSTLFVVQLIFFDVLMLLKNVLSNDYNVRSNQSLDRKKKNVFWWKHQIFLYIVNLRHTTLTRIYWSKMLMHWRKRMNRVNASMRQCVMKNEKRIKNFCHLF